MSSHSVSLKPGTRLGPYEIAAPLGAGGMGEVYRARDTRLHREVAVKVLPSGVGVTAEARARFEREARAIAALNHAHICTLYDIGREGEMDYLVLELLEGSTLRQRLAEGPLSPSEAADWGVQIAQALAAAHEKGVVHRDLKPENLLITSDGVVKILDFGLALQTAALGLQGSEVETSPGHPTLPGTVLGTVGYMAPEQVRGETADARADIFSLGCVLYEMLSGRSPFLRKTPPESLSAILRDDPPALAVLDGTVRRCLAKDLQDRFQTAREVVAALRALDALAVQPSVAVLPFLDMSAARDHAWFCEGMAEEILGALGRIPGLRVAARSSTFQFQGASQDIHRIGEALKVNKVLEGSVRTAGSRLRVTAQLVNVADGYQIWSERYDREMEDVFAVQDEIARSVAHALEVQLRPASETATPKPERNLEAYQLYLRGRHYRLVKLDLQRALRCFEQAVALDPGDPRIRAGLADVLMLLGHYGARTPRELYARARAEIDVALGLDGSSPEALAIDGHLLTFYERDLPAGERSLRHAVAADPRFTQGWLFLGFLLGRLGRPEEAEAAIGKALELDPLSHYAWYLAAFTSLVCGRLEEARARVDRCFALDPGYVQGFWAGGMVAVAEGDRAQALEMFERAVVRSGRQMFYVGLHGWGLALVGRVAEARQILEEWEARSRMEYASSTPIVPLLMELGETERAWEVAFETCEAGEAFLSILEFPWFGGMRDDPRFQELRRRLFESQPGR